MVFRQRPVVYLLGGRMEAARTGGEERRMAENAAPLLPLDDKEERAITPAVMAGGSRAPRFVRVAGRSAFRPPGPV